MHHAGLARMPGEIVNSLMYMFQMIDSDKIM